MMRRRKAEEVDLQEALEFQRRRLLNLQLPDMDSETFHHHHHQRSLSIGSPVHFPSRSVNQSMLFRSENAGHSGRFQSEANRSFLTDTDNNKSQEGGYSNHLNNGNETSLENDLPDCFFASSPSKTAETQQPESKKENCANLSVTVENKSASTIETV